MLRKSLILLPLLLAGCGSFRGWSVPAVPGLVPYTIEIQQGNVITKEMLDKLQPGMTRSQVRFVLGTPLLVDPFRTDRWDYVYFLDKKGSRVEQRQLRVYFKDDKMERYEGDLAVDGKAGGTATVKPAAAAPAVKPEAAVSAPVNPAATPATPARDPDGAANVKPTLRMVPTPGEPASPEERAAAAAAQTPASEPAAPGSLEAPPLPRLTLPPETPEPAGAAAKPDAPAKP
jgi:outer membrane protein assembly factor BamE